VRHEKIIEIIDYMIGCEYPMTASDISNRLDIHPKTAQRFIKLMKDNFFNMKNIVVNFEQVESNGRVIDPIGISMGIRNGSKATAKM
jgi:predicted ArsR family transcriptional regulator